MAKPKVEGDTGRELVTDSTTQVSTNTGAKPTSNVDLNTTESLASSRLNGELTDEEHLDQTSLVLIAVTAAVSHLGTSCIESVDEDKLLYFCDLVRDLLKHEPAYTSRIWHECGHCSSEPKPPTDLGLLKTLRGLIEFFAETRDSSNVYESTIQTYDLRLAALNVTGRNLRATIDDKLMGAGVVKYRKPIGPRMDEKDTRRRRKFARAIHELISQGSLDVNNVCWTDDLLIAKDASHMGHRFHAYARHMPFLEEDEQTVITPAANVHPKKDLGLVHIFVLLHAKIGALGPYFIQDIDHPTDKREILTPSRYHQLLEKQVIPDLKAKLTAEEFAACWWQQEGDTFAHSSPKVKQLLFETFGMKILSRTMGESRRWLHMDWPRLSSDLNPHRYIFWSVLQALLIQKGTFKTRDELKATLKHLVPLVGVQHIQRAIKDFPIRIEALLECRGAHFEHMLKDFKIRRSMAKEKASDAIGKLHNSCTVPEQPCLAEQTVESRNSDAPLMNGEVLDRCNSNDNDNNDDDQGKGAEGNQVFEAQSEVGEQSDKEHTSDWETASEGSCPSEN